MMPFSLHFEKRNNIRACSQQTIEATALLNSLKELLFNMDFVSGL